MFHLWKRKLNWNYFLESLKSPLSLPGKDAHCVIMHAMLQKSCMCVYNIYTQMNIYVYIHMNVYVPTQLFGICKFRLQLNIK